MKLRYALSDEVELHRRVMDFYWRPYDFVLWAYPWRQAGTRLAEFDGPQDWQKQVLLAIQNGIMSLDEAIRIAVASGHGVGKTALVAWLIHWFESTRPNPQVIVTANTQQQLTNKTWRELSIWQDLAINGHWFEWSATKYSYRISPNNWFASAVPWSEHNSEAFAGTHERHVMVIFDEASAISDIIWEVVEGAMTTPGAIWVAFGNPTRNSGRFRECWRRFRKRWLTLKVDARTIRGPMKNEKLLKEWEEDWGVDSDFFRVRVRGEFPRQAVDQLIGEVNVEAAMNRDASRILVPPTTPKIMGIDVARQGDDSTVFVFRQGRIMHSKIVKLNIPDLMRVVASAVSHISDERPDLITIDCTGGMGAGVYDRLSEIGIRNLVEVQFGARASKPDNFYNLRAEIWWRMKEWIETAALPQSDELMTDLTGPTYQFDSKNRIQLEKKEDMKERGLPSPDIGDALATTFIYQYATKTGHASQEMTEPEVA